LDNENPFADITIIGYKRGSDPELHPAKDCGMFMIGDLIFESTLQRMSISADLSLTSIQIQTQGRLLNRLLTQWIDDIPAIPTEGIEDHDWVLNTENARACGYTVRSGRKIAQSWTAAISGESIEICGFCLEEASK
jgi:hypothetical protein